MSDPVKIGDIYDVKSGAYFYVVKSEPYDGGDVMAEVHFKDGTICPDVIDPANPAFIKRPKRPPFPNRGGEIGMDVDGAVGLGRNPVYIPADEVDGLPWRWADGTLVTDDEKANR